MMVLWQVPAVLLAVFTWLSASSPSLGEAARKEAIRRQMVGKAARVYTIKDLPTPPDNPVVIEPPVEETTKPAVEGAAKPEAKDEKKEEKHDEKWWRARMTAAIEAADRDVTLIDAVQSRINALTTDFVNRDDPIQKARIFEDRQKALAELDRLKKQSEADQKAIDDIREEARRLGVPPGWIR
jgi:hypothetical protein